MMMIDNRIDGLRTVVQQLRNAHASLLGIAEDDTDESLEGLRRELHDIIGRVERVGLGLIEEESAEERRSHGTGMPGD